MAASPAGGAPLADANGSGGGGGVVQTAPPSEARLASAVKPRLSRTRLFLYVAGDFGLSFMWVCKFATTTAYFQTALRGGPLISHLVWSLGPLSGLFTAPVVGVLSDRCTHWLGRRRPYIIGGLVSGVVGANLFAHAGDFGAGPVPLAVAVFGFALLDIASNAIMFPARALMGDLVLPEQQHDVQGCAAVLACCAEICAGLYIASFGDTTITHVGRIFFCASVILTATVVISVIVCVETPLDPELVRSMAGEDGAELDSMGSGASDASGVVGEERRPARGDYVIDDGDEDEGDGDGSVELFSREPSLATHPSLQSGGDDVSNGGLDRGAPWEGDSTRETAPFVVAEDGKEDVETGDQRAWEQGEVAGVESGHDDHRGGPSDGNATQASRSNKRENASEIWLEVRGAVSLAMRNFPKELTGVGVVYFLAWACWFCTLPAYSVWIGDSVLGGSPTAQAGTKEANLYQRGVTLFAAANIVKALVALAFSYWYPVLLRFIGDVGERIVFGVPFIAFAFILWGWAYTKSEVAALIVIVSGSTSFIATQTIPIAIAVARFPDNLASNLGILNLFCVGAQLFDTLYTGLIAQYLGEAAVMRVGAFWGCAAGVAAFFLLQ